MLNTMSRWFVGTPSRLVQCGLWAFFAGATGLLLGMIGQLDEAAEAAALAERFPELPTWFIPEHAPGFTLATLLVCWGVWALGAGLRLARRMHVR
jgi:hypothetical protein